MPKILAIHNIGFDAGDKESGVQLWRIYRPLEELKKHVDWQIDYQRGFFLESKDGSNNVSEEDFEASGRHLGTYDIVFSSYHTNASAHSLMAAVSKVYGTKFILDDDDNTFAIEAENPFWVHMSHDQAYDMQRIVRTSKYITTTCQNLADVFSARTEVDAKVYVLPNYIPDTYQQTEPDNGDKIVIGYFGGTNHYIDFEETGIEPALQRIMHEYKNVYMTSIGIPIKTYLPRTRYKLREVVFGRKFVTDLFPTMQFDIGLAPIRQTTFSEGKSNIKWQEYTRMGAAFIGSNVGPYKALKAGTATLVENTEEAWYNGLKALVESETKRKAQVAKARKDLENWRLEKHWQDYKKVFEEVANDN